MSDYALPKDVTPGQLAFAHTAIVVKGMGSGLARYYSVSFSISNLTVSSKSLVLSELPTECTFYETTLFGKETWVAVDPENLTIIDNTNT